MLDGELWLNKRPGKRAFISVLGWSAFGFPVLKPNWLIETKRAGFW